MTPSRQLDAHHAFIRAAGMVKVDPAEAVRIAREAITMLDPRSATLDVLDAAIEPLSAEQIARELGVSRRVTRGILADMVALGYVRKGGTTHPSYTLRRMALEPVAAK